MAFLLFFGLNMKNVILIASACLVLLLILFDVDVNPQFSLPADVERPDDAQEALYTACVEEQDRIVHAETFAEVDNPDVQREILIRRMADATRQCREQHPQQTVTVREPFRFNLIDLEFRF